MRSLKRGASKIRPVPLIGIILLLTPTCRAEEVWVQVRESKLRAQPLFYAAPVAGVRYGDRVTKVGEEKGWAEVRADGVKGYLHLSAVSHQRIVLSAKDLSKIGPDSSEVVLASKGFSREIEDSYKKSDATMRYDLVDKIERVPTPSPGEVSSFIEKGGLLK